MSRSFIILLLLIPYTLALNILLSTSDSWVSKNSRHLYTTLTNQGHNVILIAPLYFNNKYLSLKDFTTTTSTTITSILDGGEFGHLLDVNQIYYKNLLKINQPKTPRNVISSSILKQQSKLVQNSNQFGHDPLNNQIWYINSNPIITLKLSFDVILPTFFPHFKPDLILFGPNEKSSMPDNLHDDVLNVLINQSDEEIPIMFIQTNDNHNIYYQDEKYFNINNNQNNNHQKHQIKKNIFTTNLQYINHKITQLIHNIMETKSSSSSSSLSSLSLSQKSIFNVIIPSINHQLSKCTTTSINNPNLVLFKSNDQHQTLQILKKRNVNLPHFKLINQDIQLIESESVTISTTGSTKSKSDNVKSLQILDDCNISVEIIDLN
ncbi:acid phosphatase-like protein [Scheffersomyces coipomensis]|uniref:acid phosphatase-like protein n=1 Tax=Scheffersomyces coipomensis TaxID=1788519 RepID=UPI00315CF5A6